MDLAWLVIVGIFLFACLTTFGFYLNVEETKRDRAGEAPAAEQGTLAAKLDAEVAGLASAMGGAEDAAVLGRLEEQELELARACEARGQTREAQIHRDIAASVGRERRAAESRSSKVA